MTQFLPPNLLALFAPRESIPYKPPNAPLTWEKDRERNPYSGISQFTSLFEDPKDTPPPTRGETKLEKKLRRIKEKGIIRAKEIEQEVKNWEPHANKNGTGDAFKTLFVARINYDTSESKLRREFDMYGPIRKINMVKDVDGKPRGYAFIEYEHERDMHSAYKNADGKKIDGRRVLVDVERGRTVKGWRPRRLGGGLGATRRGANEENVRHSGRSEIIREREEARPRDRRRSPSREKREKRPSRERERPERRDRKDRDRKRDRDRDRERSKEKDRDRDRERKHKNRDRSRERDRDGSRRKRSRDRDRNRDRSDKDREKSSRNRSDRDKVKQEPEVTKESYKNEEYGGGDQPMEQSNEVDKKYEDYKYSSQNGTEDYPMVKQEEFGSMGDQ